MHASFTYMQMSIIYTRLKGSASKNMLVAKIKC
jgi:hypothetical protein